MSFWMQRSSAILRNAIPHALRACKPIQLTPARPCQGRHYHNRSISGPKGLYLEAFSLSREILNQLMEQKIYAVMIKEFANPDACAAVARKLSSSQIKEYVNAPGIGRIGISFFETTDSKKMETAYFDEALKNISDIRGLFLPHLSPIDNLRLTIDEHWSAGANLETRSGKKMFVGLCRSLDKNKEILPHEDVLERDDPSHLGQLPLKVQIATNVYLQMPKKGGELELYNTSHDTAEYDALRGESYGIKRAILPQPILRIKPGVGDLVLFNSRLTHSVARVEDTVRISMSCFIGYRGKDHALKLWS